MMEVKLIELGKQTREFTLEDGSNVDSLLRAAGRPAIGTITRNGQAIDAGASLRNGDRIYIGSGMKGNAFDVKFIKLGQATIEVTVEDGATIKQVIDRMEPEPRASFYHADGTDAWEYRIGNAAPVSSSAPLRQPDGGTLRIVCSQKQKGNE